MLYPISFSVSLASSQSLGYKQYTKYHDCIPAFKQPIQLACLCNSYTDGLLIPIYSVASIVLSQKASG